MFRLLFDMESTSVDIEHNIFRSSKSDIGYKTVMLKKVPITLEASPLERVSNGCRQVKTKIITCGKLYTSVTINQSKFSLKARIQCNARKTLFCNFENVFYVD